MGKYIIEIDENEYKQLERIIANGTPVSTDGDLISRKQVLDELMAHQYSQDFCKDHNIEYSINSSMVRIIVNGAQAVERPQGEWVRKEDVIHSIAKQYSEHNELVPIWLSIGDMRGGAE